MKNKHKPIAWLVVSLLMLALGLAFTYWSFIQVDDASEARKKSREISLAADQFLTALVDAQAAQRGYFLTGIEAYLEPYATTPDTHILNFKILRQRSTDPVEQAHFDAIAPLLDAKLKEMDAAIALYHAHDMAGGLALIDSGEGQRLMAAIRKEIGSVMQQEKAARRRHDIAFDTNMRRLLGAIAVIGLLAFLLTLNFAFSTYRAMKQRIKDLLYQQTLHMLEEQSRINAELAIANSELQSSREHLAVTLNSIGDGVVSTDTDARIILLNPVAEDLTGWTQAEAQGRLVDEVFHIVNKTTRVQVTVPVAEALAHGTIQGLANHTVLIARDGREFDIADSCAPIRPTNGPIQGAVLVFRDVTEEYAVQQRLHDSVTLVQNILNTAVDGIATVQADQECIKTVNPALEHMFGYAQGELKGESIGLIIPALAHNPEHGSLTDFAVSEYPATKQDITDTSLNKVPNEGDETDRESGLESGRETGQEEVMGRRKDGSFFPLEISVSKMTLEGKRYFTGILRDISARKQVEAERAALNRELHEKNEALARTSAMAEKASMAKSDFLSSMSHELRSPLNAILGFAQLLESSQPGLTPKQQSNVEQILRAGWYLLGLINEVLDLAVIESGKLSISIEPISMTELMLDCKAMVEPLAQKRGIQMQFGQFDKPCFVKADRVRLKQVILNLLTNAIKYNRMNGAITVLCSEGTPNYLRLSVRDTGEGLSADELSQLFQTFNRLGQENKVEGTGIGLVVSRRLIQLMGGKIGALSTVGVGSEFWIELQQITHTPHLLADESSQPATTFALTKNGKEHTLLSIEDDPTNSELLAQWAACRTDFRLLQANTAVRGIELARIHLPDVILMDINLPGISGMDALRILRSTPLTRDIPVMALSANLVPSHIEKGLAAGFFRYLTKPIKLDEFTQALDQGLELSQAASDENPVPTSVF